MIYVLAAMVLAQAVMMILLTWQLRKSTELLRIYGEEERERIRLHFEQLEVDNRMLKVAHDKACGVGSQLGECSK